MSSIIDTLLHRTLRAGNEFEGLIPAYTGSEHNFDKDTDNSTTYDTLLFMEKWANKYAYQMKRIAPILKGRTIQETVNNIYKFLYSHFQYKLDGSLQNLYSPSAAWHFRKSGFDCKTYSLLASCILQNLNIKHSFRMVQQAGIMPNEWSHVYVIVPDNNIEYVIDATTHSNKQVTYTKKHDYVMKHRGLNSPYVTLGLGCSCQGTPIVQNKGLGAPANLTNTVANFHVFLNELEKKGLPKTVSNKMLELVRFNVENGIDPNMHEIIRKALLPTGKLGEIVPFTSYLTPAGPTFNSIPTSFTPPSSFTAPPSGFMQSGFATGAMSALSNVSVAGVPVGGITSAAMGLLSGNPMAVLGLLTSIIPIEKTFGAVFANGFDLSCWGASYSEQKAKLDIEKDIPFMGQWSGLDRVANTETFNRFQNITEAYLMDAINGQNLRFAACTRKGHLLRQNAIVELRKNTMQSFADNGYGLQPTGKRNGQLTIPSGLPGYAVGKTFGNPPYQTVYDSYNVIQPTQKPQQQQQIVYTAQGTPVTPAQQQPNQTYYTANGQPINTDATAVKSSSSSTPLLIGGALIALKLLAFS